jgi:hypothetical protein
MEHLGVKYGIYIAEIAGVSAKDNTRLQVRILPGMETLPKEYLPIWPSFFKHQAITGKVGSLVWCIANEEYTVGYILGYVNSFTWAGTYAEDSLSKSLLDKLDSIHVNLRGTVLNYRDIIVTYWNDNCIHFVQRSDGSTIVAYTSGTLSVTRPTEILQSVQNGASVRINRDEVVISAGVIRLAGKVRLGENPKGQVLVTQGGLGKNGLPADDVWA